MTAYEVDPFERSVTRISLPRPRGEEDPLLMVSSIEEGADGRDFEACARRLTGRAAGLLVNAYTLWTRSHERAVLFVPDRTEGSRHGFRIGRPARRVKAAVFYGKGIVLRYENAVVGIHRTSFMAGIDVTPPTLPAPARLDVWSKAPAVEWVEGHHSRFSGPATSPVVLDTHMGRPCMRRVDVGLPACAACGRVGQSLLKCGRCARVKYCDKNCQREHWRVHKADCHT